MSLLLTEACENPSHRRLLPEDVGSFTVYGEKQSHLTFLQKPKMVKIILIIILCFTSINAVQHNPTEGIYASTKAITRCLATNLYQDGYIMDIQGTDIPGIDKEFTVHYQNSKSIAGIFWIANSIFGGQEKTVGIYDVNERTRPDFVQIMHQCAKKIAVENHY
ncbi:TPA: hypothetical protein JDL67_004091 [Salmonella enterica subsp. salamae]|nr:hypothetical protein [Salmonella enterica subsp. salamae]